MKREVYVHPAFANLLNYIEKVPENYSTIGHSIHTGRNEVRVVTANGCTLAIKYFRKISLINRAIFATVRKSKARRSFEHSTYLLSRGIDTPQPVAYINCYKHGLLSKSYYISVYSNYRPLSELLELSIKESEEALKAFAIFSYKLHCLGIIHNDYTVKNILYAIEHNEYKFSLIDNNRMNFRQYNYAHGLKDLERLKIPVDKLGIIAAEYAKQANVSSLRTINAMIFFRMRYMLRNTIKKRIKTTTRYLKFGNT